MRIVKINNKKMIAVVYLLSQNFPIFLNGNKRPNFLLASLDELFCAPNFCDSKHGVARVSTITFFV